MTGSTDGCCGAGMVSVACGANGSSSASMTCGTGSSMAVLDRLLLLKRCAVATMLLKLMEGSGDGV